MKHSIGQTASHVEVYVDLITSEAGKQISYQPHLFSLAKEVLASTTPPNANIIIEHDMGRPIGYNQIVVTTDESIVFYGRLYKDDVLTRLVKNEKPQATRYLSLQLVWDTSSYNLTNIWVGRLRPPIPGSAAEVPESKRYWANHAVIYTDQRLEANTITKECPY